jgi:hypothetical protein
VLACAAVVGLEFDPAVVQAAGEFSEDGVLTALEAAVTTRLVLEVPGPVPRNRFSHALIRATLYDELTAAHRQLLLDAARQAQEQGAGEALARAALANSRGLFSISERVDAERVAVLEAALEVTGSSDSALRARLLANLASELVFSIENDRRWNLFSEAVAMARRLDDLVTLGQVLARAGSLAGPSAELRAQCAELTDVAARLADPVLAYWGEMWSGLSALSGGDGQGHEQHLRAAAQLAAELGQPFLQWLSSNVGSCRAAVAGQLAEAEAIADETLRMGQAAGLPDAFRVYGANLYWVRHAQGRLDEQLDLLARAAARDEASPITRAAYALALCELDRPAEARPVLEAVATQEFQRFANNYSWLYGLCLAASVCAAIGDAENAGVLVALLSPNRGLIGHIGGGLGTIERRGRALLGEAT